MENDIYSLDELIKILEEIKENGEGNLNFAKAFYCLAKEIEKIKLQISEGFQSSC